MSAGINDTKQWYAIRVKFRAEKIALRLLEESGIRVYCPLKSYTRIYRRKIRHHVTPLLPCFLFIEIDKRDYINVLNTPYVIGFVRIGSDILPVQQSEIDLLRRIEGIDNITEVSEQHFEVGEEVMVSQGPLFGLSGRIVTIHSKDKLIVEMESLPVVLAIEIDRKLLTFRHPQGLTQQATA